MSTSFQLPTAACPPPLPSSGRASEPAACDSDIAPPTTWGGILDALLKQPGALLRGIETA